MIRRVFLLVIAAALMAGVLFAQDNKSVTLTGYLIDNACAANHANDKTFSAWVKTHGTSCATMESCEKSGYAVFADDKLYKFDDNGNNSVADLLKNTKSKKGLHVKAEGTVVTTYRSMRNEADAPALRSAPNGR